MPVISKTEFKSYDKKEQGTKTFYCLVTQKNVKAIPGSMSLNVNFKFIYIFFLMIILNIHNILQFVKSLHMLLSFEQI